MQLHYRNRYAKMVLLLKQFNNKEKPEEDQCYIDITGFPSVQLSDDDAFVFLSQEGSIELNPIPYGEAGVSLRSLSGPENQQEWPFQRAVQ